MAFRLGRLRLQFSIGTMFVLVTLIALWLTWELNYIRERRTTKAWVEQQGGSAVTVSEWNRAVPTPFSPLATATIPFWRRWLGDEAMHRVELPYTSTEADLARVDAIFPEAESAIAPQGFIGTYEPFPTPAPEAEKMMKAE